MKTLILVRHAKSSWKDINLDDFDRPLKKRGKKDVLLMGKKLKERQVIPDLILSSPAKRAKKTAKVIAKAIVYPKKKIFFNYKMYHSSAKYLLEMVRNMDDNHKTIMLFGHNLELTDFADLLLTKNPVYNIVTTGVYCIKFNVNYWHQIQKGKGEAVFYDYPKRYAAE